MPILETLEGEDPEILDRGDTLERWSKSGFKNRTTYQRGESMPRNAKRPTVRPTMRQATAKNGAYVWHHYGSAPRAVPGRYVGIPNNPDAESLEGWLTDIKKATSSAVRSVGSVGMDVVRSVAPVVGTVVGKAVAAGTAGAAPAAAAGGGGIMGQLSSLFSPAPAPAAAPAGAGYVAAPAQAPASSFGGIPPVYLMAGGAALVLVLLLKK